LQIFPNLVANDYKSHVVVNGMVTFWLTSTSVGNIKAIDVFVQHYHNLLVHDNNVVVSNDVNDMFGKALIDVYLLGVFNLKGYVHS